MNTLFGLLGKSAPHSTSSVHPGILTINLKETEHLLPSIPDDKDDLVVVSAPGERSVEPGMWGSATFQQNTHVHVGCKARQLDGTRFVTVRSKDRAPIFYEYPNHAEALAGMGRLMVQDVAQHIERCVE